MKLHLLATLTVNVTLPRNLERGTSAPSMSVAEKENKDSESLLPLPVLMIARICRLLE